MHNFMSSQYEPLYDFCFRVLGDRCPAATAFTALHVVQTFKSMAHFSLQCVLLLDTDLRCQVVFGRQHQCNGVTVYQVDVKDKGSILPLLPENQR